MGFVLLFLWTAVTEAEYMKYKDPKQPLSARIKDLMSRMTTEEKIGQMVQIERLVTSADVMKNYFIGMQIQKTKVEEKRWWTNALNLLAEVLKSFFAQTGKSFKEIEREMRGWDAFSGFLSR